MKRVWISLSILTGVLVVGAIAIAQVQRSDRDGSHAGAQLAAGTESAPAIPEPIPMPQASQAPASETPSDPFASSRLMPATHSVLVPSGGGDSTAASPASAETAAESAAPSQYADTGSITPPNPYRGASDTVAAPPQPLEAEGTPISPSEDAYAAPAASVTGQIAQEYDSPYSGGATPAYTQPETPSPVAYQNGDDAASDDAGSSYAPSGDSASGGYEPPATTPPATAAAPATPPSTYGDTSGGYQAPAAQPVASDYGGGAGAPYQQARAETDYSTPAATGPEGAGVPGDAALEGVQSAQLTIEKIVPPEIQVGRAATFRIVVSNVGHVAATKVVLRDEVPSGTRLVSSVPEATQGATGGLLFDLGTLDAGEVAEVVLELMPLVEGEIGSVATISFQTQASGSTICTRPELVLEHTLPERVLIGQPVELLVTISNTGTGAAERVILEEDVPAGLSHPQGRELEYEVGTLEPGGSRQLRLTLTAEQAGFVENIIRARGEGNLLVEDSARIEVTAPQLAVEIAGPTRRFLDREATYTLQLSNPGTAPANEIELVAYLPRGLQFVSTNNAGQYDSSQHAVYWSLAELPSQQSGTVEVVTLPIEMGDQKIRAEGRAEMNLVAESEHDVSIDGIAELFFEVADVADPIEIGNQTTYEVRVINQGSKTATNVQLVAELPAGIQAVGGEGPTRADTQGQRVAFQPLARLAPKADTLYTITVTGMQAGDHRIRFSVSSDETSAVMKEEATRVYADQ